VLVVLLAVVDELLGSGEWIVLMQKLRFGEEETLVCGEKTFVVVCAEGDGQICRLADVKAIGMGGKLGELVQ